VTSDGPAVQTVGIPNSLNHGCGFIKPSIKTAFSPINVIKTMNYFGEIKKKKKKETCTRDSEDN
jgi:hypothetical protein